MIANFPTHIGMTLKQTLVLKKDWDIQRKILWDLSWLQCKVQMSIKTQNKGYKCNRGGADSYKILHYFVLELKCVCEGLQNRSITVWI